MPIEVVWADQEKTIVQYTFTDKWTWAEFYPALQQALEMETSVTHRVDVIVDMRNSPIIPSNALSNIKIIANKQPPNLRLSVLVSANALVSTLLNLAGRLNQNIARDYRMVATMEEAHKRIQQDREQGA